MKQLLRFTPIIFFMLMTLLWFYQEYAMLGIINYTCIAVFAALAAQLKTDYKTTGFWYGILFVLFSGAMLIYAYTMYADAAIVSGNSDRLFYQQLALFGTSFFMAILMVYYNRYYTDKK